MSVLFPSDIANRLLSNPVHSNIATDFAKSTATLIIHQLLEMPGLIDVEVLKAFVESNPSPLAFTIRKWEFEIGATVYFAINGKEAKVVGRAEYANCNPRYFLRFEKASEHAEDWFDEDAIVAEYFC